MKSILLTTLFCTSTCFGSFEPWTSKDGRTAQLDLIKTTGDGDDLSGEFRMKNLQTVTIKATDLDEDSATRLAKAKAAADAANAPDSVFEKVLKDNLVKVSGKSLEKCTDATKPTKYYVFYYTASWCGPCHRYTPTLVALYNKIKPDNSNFELVLITNDRDEKAMTGYAVEANMPWPQLKLSAVRDFGSKFDHGVTGIPAVVVCDLEGKIVKKTRDLAELETLLK